MFTTVDLFAGAGGLSYGFERTGKVRIVAAAEKNLSARKTYRKNHSAVKYFYEDVQDIDYDEIKSTFGNIDLVIGGPPCQGFSNANRQHTTMISMNNRLVKEFVRGVCELKPKAFLMENVAMLRSQVHRFIVDESDFADPYIQSLNLRDDKLELLPADALFEGAIEIAQKMDTCQIQKWTDKRVTVFTVLYRYRINQLKFDKAIDKHKKYLLSELSSMLAVKGNDPVSVAEKAMAEALLKYINEHHHDFLATIESIKRPLFTQRMLERLQEIRDYNIHVYSYEIDNDAIVACVKTYAVLDYIKGVLQDRLGYTITERLYNAADYGAPQNRERFIIVGLSKDVPGVFIPPVPNAECLFSKRTVRDAIADIENVEPFTDITEKGIPLPHREDLSNLAKELRGSVLYNHICTDTTDIARARFSALKSGQNFHDLDPSLKTTYSNAERTQNTIYMRLNYDQPCGTVVNVRKSMWIHPVHDRAISIREAARLQTFPDSYVFEGTKDSQYQQVGNAVPPILATAIAIQLIKAIDE